MSAWPCPGGGNSRKEMSEDFAGIPGGCMYVNVGNSNAIEGFRDPTSDDPDMVRYRPVTGDRVTEVVFPEGISLSEAFSTTLAVMDHHIAAGKTPTSVESDSAGLTSLLQEHWGLTAATGD